MGARIFVNGKEVKEALAVVDTANNKVSFETAKSGEKIIDKRKVYVEVNIYGDIDPSRIEVF